jgi:MFS family permease
VGAGTFLTIGAFEALWGRFLADRGASNVMIAVGVTIFTAPLIILAPIGGRIADRYGPARVAIAGLTALPVVIVVLAAPLEYWPTMPIAIAQGVLVAVCLPAGQATIATGSPDNLLAAGQALNGAVSAAAAAVASIAAATIYAAWGGPATWLTLAAAITLLAALAYYWKPTATKLERITVSTISPDPDRSMAGPADIICDP